MDSETNCHLVFEINDNDVLCGRGGSINAFRGNQQFRSFVNTAKSSYRSKFNNSEKNRIIESIITAISQQEPSGRFLKECPKNPGCWRELDHRQIKNKVIQAMRRNKRIITCQNKKNEEVLLNTTTTTHQKATNSAGANIAEVISPVIAPPPMSRTVEENNLQEQPKSKNTSIVSSYDEEEGKEIVSGYHEEDSGCQTKDFQYQRRLSLSWKDFEFCLGKVLNVDQIILNDSIQMEMEKKLEEDPLSDDDTSQKMLLSVQNICS